MTGRPAGAGEQPEPFVSYAQNGEDVVLWRALHGYGPGFYIDVGAGDPLAESVTKAFYELGWRGINVEPMRETFERLADDRHRDVNLQLALEDLPGTKTYFSVDGGNGLSTGVEDYAKRYVDEGWTVDEVDVTVDTLANVCRAHVQGEIHFLKIDVEGCEQSVLRGADFEAFRPWIVVVEATIPNSNVSTASTWEKLLTDNDYKFVFFDGLNRFYVAREKAAIFAEVLSVPPNALDNFVRFTELEVREQRAQLQSDLETSKAEVDYAQQEVFEGSRQIALLAREVQNAADRVWERDEQLEEVARRYGELQQQQETDQETIGELRAELDDVYGSRSWRLTRPLRAIVRRASGARSRFRRG
jgi:FkbM family methyltransferase